MIDKTKFSKKKKMNHKIKAEELEKLEGFIGYGKPNAKIIFIGIEERGGGYENLRIRLSMENYEYLDCKRFHLDNLGVTHLHNENEKFAVEYQPVWRFMSYFMLRLKEYEEKEILAKKGQMLREYQNNHLGTKNENGETLLTDLFPIPCDNDDIWGTEKESYIDIIDKYGSKNIYKKAVLPKRKKIFEKLINSNEFSASAIICFGKGEKESYWKEYEEFFSHFGVKFERINTSKKCKMGILNNRTKIFLTPFFGQGQINYKTLGEIVDKMKTKS